jgi:hypothetical protein
VLVPFTNILVWAKLSFTGVNSVHSWIISGLRGTLNLYSVNVKAFSDRIVLISKNGISKEILFSPSKNSFSSFYFKTLTFVNEVVLYSSQQIVLVPMRTWIIFGATLMGAGVTSFFVYLIIKFVKHPDIFFAVVKPILKYFKLPTSSEEVMDLVITQLKQKGRTYVQESLEKFFSKYFDPENVDKRAENFVSVLEEFFFT